MLFLNPSTVTFLGRTLDNVRALAIDRTPLRLVAEQSDLGPHCVFADVPEQRVTVRIDRALTADEAGPPRPGESGALAVRAGAGADDAGVRQYAATVVVTEVKYELSARGGARQQIEAVAISSTGAADPITESEAAL